MVTTIIILSVLLLAAVAFIFWLLWVLKNTFDITENVLDIAANKIPRSLSTAHDGQYYPATVIAKVEFDSESEMTITDFSMYEDKKIIGFTICTQDSMEKYYGPLINELDDEEIELLKQPVIFKNVIVYAPREGMWTWKSVE